MRLAKFCLFSLTLMLAACDNEVDAGFKNIEVKFFSDHPDIKVIHGYETTSEETLKVFGGACREGAKFDTLYEPYINVIAHETIQIFDSTQITMVTDAENQKVQNFTCYDFFNTNALKKISVPDQMANWEYYKVIEEGDGDYCHGSVTYGTLNYISFVSEPKIELRLGESRASKVIGFRIPADMSFEEYMEEQGMGCLNKHNYRVLNK